LTALASPKEITVSVTGAAASVMEVVVFGGCDENACIAQSPPNSSVLAPVCLDAGTYTVGLRYGVDAIMGYEVSLHCNVWITSRWTKTCNLGAPSNPLFVDIEARI